MDTSKISESTAIIESFVRHYSLEKHAFKKIAQMVMHECRRSLSKSDPEIPALFTCRAKRKNSLYEKLKIRNGQRKEPYKSIEDIRNDVFDMAGVRIALYIPSQSDVLVVPKLKRLFEENPDFELHQLRPAGHATEHNENRNKSYQPRFSSYQDQAIHFQILVKVSVVDSDGDDSDSGVPEAGQLEKVGVEIQIIPLTTHVWAELEHDIEYKKKKGIPTMGESRLLDGLHGILSAANVFVEHLDETRLERITAPKKKFSDIGDLFTFLRTQPSGFQDYRRNERQIRPLFEMLEKLNRNSREKIAPILDDLTFDAVSNATRSLLDKKYAPLKPRDSVYIMARVLDTVAENELEVAIQQEKIRKGNELQSARSPKKMENEEIENSYRCVIVVDCLKWFISSLFEPLDAVEEILGQEVQKLNGRSFEAFQWALDGSTRPEIMSGTLHAKQAERYYGHLEILWSWFSSSEVPMILFAFQLSSLGIHAPGEIEQTNRDVMYIDLLRRGPESKG